MSATAPKRVTARATARLRERAAPSPSQVRGKRIHRYQSNLILQRVQRASAIGSATLAGSAHRVWDCLQRHQERTGIVIAMSYARIATETGLSLRSVARGTSALLQWGAISVEREHDRQTRRATAYKLHGVVTWHEGQPTSAERDIVRRWAVKPVAVAPLIKPPTVPVAPMVPAEPARSPLVVPASEPSEWADDAPMIEWGGPELGPYSLALLRAGSGALTQLRQDTPVQDPSVSPAPQNTEQGLNSSQIDHLGLGSGSENSDPKNIGPASLDAARKAPPIVHPERFGTCPVSSSTPPPSVPSNGAPRATQTESATSRRFAMLQALHATFTRCEIARSALRFNDGQHSAAQPPLLHRMPGCLGTQTSLGAGVTAKSAVQKPQHTNPGATQ